MNTQTTCHICRQLDNTINKNDTVLPGIKSYHKPPQKIVKKQTVSTSL